MVDGTLSMESFQYYVIQDALYLADFADCLHRLSQAPGISESTSQRLIAKERGVKVAEMELHGSFFVQWNINIDANGAEQMPNCLLYTSYMKRIVATRCFAEGVAVLLPCAWVYMHVGKKMLELRQKLGDSVTRPPQFDAWIDKYASEEFEAVVLDYIDLVESACRQSSSDEKTIHEMKQHFIMSCKLEHMFWDQALEC